MWLICSCCGWNLERPAVMAEAVWAVGQCLQGLDSKDKGSGQGHGPGEWEVQGI